MALRTSFWTCSWRGRNRFMDVITASTSPLVELLGTGSGPLLRLPAGGPIDAFSQIRQMFTGMIEIHDFDGPGKMQRGNPPDPRSTISQHHHPGGLSQTATHRLRIDPPTEGLGGLNGAHVGRGVFVPQGISLVVLFGLGE